MKKLILILFIFLFPIVSASANIYEEIEQMIQQEEEAKAQKDDLPDPYLEHSTSFFEEIECKEIQIYNKALNIHIGTGSSLTLDARPMPLNTTNKNLTFLTQSDIITVDKNGVVTPVGNPGSAEVKIKCGDVEQTVKINVIQGVEGISLSRQDMLFYIDRPITAKLDAIITPSNATNKNVKWYTENGAVASVDENGVVTPIGTGTTNIVAESEDGGFKAKCIVYVQIYDIPVRGAFITNAVDAIPVSTDYTLTSYLYPQNARDKSTFWYSSNPEIVTIDENGTLHAHAEGMSVITLRSSNGAEDTFTISCVANDESFTYNYISLPVEDRIAALSMPVVYSHYASSFESALEKQAAASPTVFTTNASAASRSDVAKYMNPQNFTTGYAKYQFLDLSRTNGISTASLNSYLSGKGVLDGKGEAIISAAKANGISEIYLAVHSVLESGSGTSKLASGIEYNGTTVYNLFGIGAYDRDPINEGAKYAYEQGWTSVDAAIYGGAQWISKYYINAGQNTLYKMKWNPENPATHQYATDVAWAVKQARTIKSLVEACGGAVVFDLPVYSGQSEYGISWD